MAMEPREAARAVLLPPRPSETASPRPQLSQGTICYLNFSSKYGLLQPCKNPSQLHSAQASPSSDRTPTVYFKLPSPDLTSCCETAFLTLQIGDTLEFITNLNPDKPRAIYTRLVACSGRSMDDMASYLQHILSLINRPDDDFPKDYILREINKAPQGLLLVLQHPNPDRKLIVLVLKLAKAISDGHHKLCSSLYISKIKEFFRLLARSPFVMAANAGLCKLLVHLQNSGMQSTPSLSLFRSVCSDPNNLLQEVESEWGKPLAEFFNSIKGLVLKMLRQIPEDVCCLFNLIQILDNMQTKSLEQLDGNLPSSRRTSFAMQVLDTIAHANGADDAGNLNAAWYELPLLPLPMEMFSSLDHLHTDVNLPVAKLNGSYDSPEAYIDTYFRLLREDAFASLKKCISDFSRGCLDSRDMTMWFEVHTVGVHFEFSLPGVVVGLQLRHGQTNSMHPKLPLPGSLLCMCDMGGCFRNPLWSVAVRCESKSKTTTVLFVEVLKVGVLVHDSSCLGTLSVPWARILHASNMVVAECPAYFRAYEPVLKALQHLDAETMPFQSELVLGKPSRKAPDYLNSSTLLDWSPLVSVNSSSTHGDLKAGIHALEQLDQSGFHTHLDASQVAAVNHVLQNQLAIIQGPPGTGKTHLSVKIVQLLLSASFRPAKPVLIVTYKNKALDQFLEACLGFCKCSDIVRVGGRSKADKLASCNMQHLLSTGRYNKLSFSNWLANCTKLAQLQAELEQALTSLYECRTVAMNTITSQLSLQAGFLQKLLNTRARIQLTTSVVHSQAASMMATDKTFNRRGQLQLAQRKQRNLLRRWIPEKLAQREQRNLLRRWIPEKAVFNAVQACLLSHIPASKSRSDHLLNILNNSTTKKESVEPRKDYAAEVENEYRREFDDIWQDTKRVSQTIPRQQKDAGWLSKNFLHLEDLNRNEYGLLEGTSLGNLDLNAYTWLVEADPWELSAEHRCILILLIMQRNLEERLKNFLSIKEQYDQICLEIAEVNKKQRIDILKEAKIIGMTTTGAAINQDILAAISPAIILVEEAAEILEPHLTALLSPSVKHFILVGDHKQLRPSVECHELEIRYNLGISMLERLAEYNKLPFQTLGFQSRMREEFLQMVRPIYPHLKSNIFNVNGRNNQPSKCMASTMYFWNHSSNETAARSPTNKQEAYMVLALVKWLLSEGHTPDEITIICAYNGQVGEIRRRLNELGHEEETVDVQTIDRFQGSENQITIASLVRSNMEGRIGHLSAQNRLCVTVSRARSGLYLCGNAETLSQKSPQWKTLIDECFRARNNFGDNILLICPRHPEDPPIPLHNDKAAFFSPNVCTKPCKATLTCGHHCTRTCHNNEHALCKVPVSHKFAICLHSIMKLCSVPEASLKCKEVVWTTLEACGHKKQCACWEKTEKIPRAMECHLPCTKTLACEHPCTLVCGQECHSKPCPACAQIEMIKAQKQKDLLIKQTKDKLSDINSQIEKLRNEPESGPYFITLQPEGEAAAEYHMVKDRTEKFIQPTHKVLPVVTKIEKVTNARLQLKFLQAQQTLTDVLAPSQLLFHGTDDQGIQGITNNGFKLPSESKKNMFGVGCYFAADSSKSAQHLYTKGSNKLLLCEVLLGRTWSLTSEMPYLNKNSIRLKMYDSVFSIRNSRDSGGTQFDEYVVYNPDQAIPRYVVHYRNLDSGDWELRTIFQRKANLAFERRPLDASPSTFKGVTNDELHFRFAEAQFLRMSDTNFHKVTSVEYIWNQVLHERYEKLKQKFVEDSKPVNEILVFHGTLPESIDKISREGFKVGGTDGVPIRCGAAHGSGVYTAKNPEISVEYSGGHGMMLLSLALLGKLDEDFTYGGDTDIYVIKNGDQLLPRYVVHFVQRSYHF